MPDDWLAVDEGPPEGRQTLEDEYATLGGLTCVRHEGEPSGATQQIVALDAVVMAARETLRPEMANRSIIWRPMELGDAVCDPQLMQQVFVSLLSESLRSTRQRTPAVIQVGAFVLKGEQVVFVRDNSASTDMQRDDNEAGGKGFATAAGIIRRQGGKAWANADVASGATVYFTVRTPAPQHGTLAHRPAGP